MPAIKIEFLMGRGAAKSHHNPQDKTEWPPHPDRLFQALVAAWGQNDENQAGEQALKWLEALPPPDIYAPSIADCLVEGYGVRASKIRLGDKKKRGKYLRIINGSELKGAWVREFFAYQHPAGASSDAPLSAWIVWNNDGDRRHIGTLKQLAARVPYFGRSTSPALVSVHEMLPSEADDGMTHYVPTDISSSYSIRVPDCGRFDALLKAYKEKTRNKPLPADQFYIEQDGKVPPAPATWQILFTLSLQGRPRPPLEQTAEIMRAMRNTLLKQADGEVAAVKEFVSGHTADGGVMRTRHLALLPLANVGHTNYPDAAIHGIAVAVPEGVDHVLSAAVGQLFMQITDNPKLRLCSRWRLQAVDSSVGFSLRHQRYSKASVRWETVTPAIISDFLPKDGTKKKKRDRRLRKMFTDSGCPEPYSVELSRHSAVVGVPPSFKFHDDELRHKHSAGHKTKRLSLHIAVTFNQPVQGPLLVGAGAHRGMGLMLPM